MTKLTSNQIDAAVEVAVEGLASITRTGEKLDKSKAELKSAQEETYAAIHSVLDQMDINKEDDTRKYAENPDFYHFRNDVLAGLSKKLKEKVETKEGSNEPTYSPRVKKQFSRVIGAWKRGDLETQSAADKENKAVAKKRAAEDKAIANIMRDAVSIWPDVTDVSATQESRAEAFTAFRAYMERVLGVIDGKQVASDDSSDDADLGEDAEVAEAA